MKVAIHQPDFMPWLGFFSKIYKADCWIVLDHVENNPRDAAFWCRRVKILVNGKATWVSIPLNKPHREGVIGVPICDMTINDSDPRTMKKLLNTVKLSYANAPFFNKYFFLAEAYFTSTDVNLSQRNLKFILSVFELLGISRQIITSSELGIRSKGTQLLVDLILKVGGNTYISGDGADGYQQADLYKANNIELEFNSFTHPVYDQLRAQNFVPGLSILDSLFLVGEEVVASWVRKQ